MKGQIPPTHFIALESEESQWRLLTRGLINELKTSGLIEREPGKSVRIRLVIKKIIPPEQRTEKNTCLTTGLEELSFGLSRSNEFLHDFLGKGAWLFAGYIEGDEKKPIFIVYYATIKLSVYTQQLISEKTENFFPGLMLN